MEWVAFLLGVGTVVSIGLLSSGLLSAERRLRRAMRKVPRTLIHDARDGRAVKLVGKLRFVGEPLRAPLSGRACGYYRLRVIEHPNRRDQRVLVVDEQRRDFLLVDPTGHALVRVAEAKIFAQRDFNATSGVFDDPSPELLALLARYHESPKGWFFNRDLRYEEAILDGAEDVAVGGVARWEPDPSGAPPSSYRDPPMRLVIEATGKIPLFVSDDTKVMR